jgi:multidrug resistance protein
LPRSPLVPIALIVAVDVLGLTLMIPLLPFYAERMGATPAGVGLLLASYAVCQLFAGPVLGQLSDRFGRRPVLLVSQAGTFASFLLLGFAEQLWLVFAARILDGITAGNLTVAQAYIADVTKPEDRARAFGIIGIAFGLGFLLGPAISGFLAQYSYHYPIFAAAALSFLSICATYFLLPRTTPVPSEGRLSILNWARYATFARRPGLGPLLGQFLAFVLSFAIFSSGFALFAERRLTWNGAPFGPKECGYVYAYAGFLGILTQGPALGRLVRRLGERRLAFAGFLGLVCGYLALGFTYTVPVLLAATTLCSLGGVVRPVVTSRVTQAVERGEQGTVLGLTQSLTSVSQIAGPVIAGWLIEHALLSEWAFAAAAIAAAGLVLGRLTPAAPAATG